MRMKHMVHSVRVRRSLSSLYMRALGSFLAVRRIEEFVYSMTYVRIRYIL